MQSSIDTSVESGSSTYPKPGESAAPTDVDDGQPFLFSPVPNTLALSYSVYTLADRQQLDGEHEPLPFNDTGDVWTFENVPEETARRLSVIRTSFPCYGCSAALWDSSFEPDVDVELSVSLDERAVCNDFFVEWLELQEQSHYIMLSGANLPRGKTRCAGHTVHGSANHPPFQAGGF
jgi:hypothetical protein